MTRWSLSPSLLDGDGALRLRELRALLRAVADAVLESRPPPADVVARLNGILAAGPLRRRFEVAGKSYRVHLESVDRSASASLAAIAAELVDFLAAGDPQRLRACANPACRYLFVDASRNRVRRWCDASGCGNLMKVRRFRERRRNAGAPEAATRGNGRSASSEAESSGPDLAIRRPRPRLR